MKIGRKNKQLIDSLCKDLKPVERLWQPWLRTVLWVGVSLLWVVLMVWGVMGLNSHRLSLLTRPWFVQEAILSLTMGISAAYAASWLSLPDGAQRKRLMLLPLVCGAILIGLVGFRMYGHMHMHELQMHIRHFHREGQCLPKMLWLCVGALIPMALLLRRGASVVQGQAGIMAMLATVSFAYFGVRVMYGGGAAAYVLIYQLVPAMLLLGLGGWLLSRYLRW